LLNRSASGRTPALMPSETRKITLATSDGLINVNPAAPLFIPPASNLIKGE
jgi:hypothetical protein